MNTQTNYRYSLDKRRGTKKAQCPKCGQKTFSLYVDTHNHHAPLSPVCGRCSRENNCAYHLPPRELFAKDPSTRPKGRGAPPARPAAPPAPDFLDTDFVRQSMAGTHTDNGFTQWLGSLPFVGEAMGRTLIERYRLGGTRVYCDAVVFWQIDTQGRVRTGKIMRYNPQTGKRIKDDRAAHRIGWVHSELKRHGGLVGDFHLEQCFFGAHLLVECSPDAVVAVFEGEKTAVVASAVFPELVCLASGGLNGLTVEKCRVLSGRKVVFFPDLQCVEQWRARIRAIAQEVCFAYWEVNTVLEEEASPDEKMQGLDLCDYIIKEFSVSQN